MFSEIIKFFLFIFTPLFLRFCTSSKKTKGSKTTPLPIIQTLFFLIIPEGNSESLNSSLSINKVCPALFPPET